VGGNDGNGHQHHYLVEGDVDANVLLPPTLFMCFGRNPRSESPRSEDDNTFGVVRPVGGIVLEHVLAEGVPRWSGVFFCIEDNKYRRRGLVWS
jgi:hypothetical protein